MKRKILGNTSAKRRHTLKARHRRMLHRHKQFFTFLQYLE